MPKQFRVPKVVGPEEPFEFVFEVPETTKVNTGTEEEPVWEEQPNGNWVEETRIFHVRRARIPAGVVMRVQDPGEGGDPRAGGRQAAAVRELFRLSVVEFDAFMALLDDTRTVVDADTVNDLIGWLIERAAGRPTN